MIEVLITLTIGLVFGSFANNVISYFVNENEFDLLRSRCMCGKKELKFFELIPLVSYLGLEGKCNECEQKVPIRYFLIELFSGILALISLFKYGISLELPIYYFTYLIMLMIAFVDFEKFIIPNILLGALLIISIVKISLLNSELILDIFVSLSLFAVFSALNIFYSKYRSTEAIGSGDIKYIAVLTLVFTYLFSLIGLWVSALIAIPGSYIINNFNRSKKKDKRIPFGVFLSLGYFLTNLFAIQLLNVFEF